MTSPELLPCCKGLGGDAKCFCPPHRRKALWLGSTIMSHRPGTVYKGQNADNMRLVVGMLIDEVAALTRAPSTVEVERRLGGSMKAQWTYDPEAHAYYFAPWQAALPPYLQQIHVDAIIDVASDGTLAGVEIIDSKAPPPPNAIFQSPTLASHLPGRSGEQISDQSFLSAPPECKR